MANLERRIEHLESGSVEQAEQIIAAHAEYERWLELRARDLVVWTAVLETMSAAHQEVVYRDWERDPELRTSWSNLTRQADSLVHEVRAGWHTGPLALPEAIGQVLIDNPSVSLMFGATDCEDCGLRHPSRMSHGARPALYPLQLCALCGGRVAFNGHLLKHGHWPPSGFTLTDEQVRAMKEVMRRQDDD